MSMISYGNSGWDNVRMTRAARRLRPEQERQRIVHPVKPVWCVECDAYHVECEFGCCVIGEE
jgi:hypothetical protein